MHGRIIELIYENEEPELKEEMLYDSLAYITVGADYVANLDEQDYEKEMFVEQFKNFGFFFIDKQDERLFLSVPEGSAKRYTDFKIKKLKEHITKYEQEGAEDPVLINMSNYYMEDVTGYGRHGDTVIYSKNVLYSIEQFVMKCEVGKQYFVGNILDFHY